MPMPVVKEEIFNGMVADADEGWVARKLAELVKENLQVFCFMDLAFRQMETEFGQIAAGISVSCMLRIYYMLKAQLECDELCS